MAGHDLRAVAFPTLDQAQIEKLGRCAGASLKHYQDRQALFKVGEREFKFFVVKSDEVEIVDESGETPKTKYSTIKPERRERLKPQRCSASLEPCRGPIGCPRKSRQTLGGLSAPVRL
jgi:hypothetical protein